MPMWPSDSRSENPAMRPSTSATQVDLVSRLGLDRSSFILSGAHARTCEAVYSREAISRTEARKRSVNAATSVATYGRIVITVVAADPIGYRRGPGTQPPCRSSLLLVLERI